MENHRNELYHELTTSEGANLNCHHQSSDRQTETIVRMKISFGLFVSLTPAFVASFQPHAVHGKSLTQMDMVSATVPPSTKVTKEDQEVRQKILAEPDHPGVSTF